MNVGCFLDRDGVINRAYVRNGKPYPPSSFEEFDILLGVKESLEKLNKSGFYCIVVTNQPDVKTRNDYKMIVDAIHEKIRQELAVHDIFVCCEREGSWYKPNPGMLLAAAEKYNIDLTRSFMIGDRWRDIGAGKAAGCHTIFIDYKYDEKLEDKPDFICSNLPSAVKYILEKE